MTTIALGVSSSISIYKACEVLRGFQKNGAEVQVVMTRNAASLISPRLFASLSGRPAAVEMFGGDLNGDVISRDLQRPGPDEADRFRGPLRGVGEGIQKLVHTHDFRPLRRLK